MSDTVSDFILERLTEWNVRRIYGFPGDGINGLMGAIGEMPVQEEGVNKYFNNSTGDGDLGKGATGPWNQGNGWELVDSPAFANYKMPK